MKLLYEGGLLMALGYAALILLVFALVVIADPLICWFSQRKHRQSIIRAHRRRSF